MKLPFNNDIPIGMTVGQLADKLYPGITYDATKPQSWVDYMRDEHNFDVRSVSVWGYTEDAHLMGKPLPLTQEMATKLKELNLW